jgi:aminopeptidase YwaD
MRKYLFLVFIFYSACFTSGSHAQTLNPYYQTIVNNVSYDTLLKNLQAFQSFGVKNLSSQGIENTKNWLLAQYVNYGYTDIALDSFFKLGKYQYNIIVTKTGTVYPDTYLIVDGHYDTWIGPGTDDNGSGTCIILEIARLLKNINTEYSVKFINFTGEESGWFGSYHYIDSIVNPQNMNIRLVFNIDMVGGVAGNANDTLECERDTMPPYASNALSDDFTDTLVVLTEIYSSLKTKKGGAWGSDYIPFQENGNIITGYFENNLTTNNNWHTLGDTLGNLDTSYVFEVCKASTGSALYFSHANSSSGISDHELNTKNIFIYPNPFHNELFIKVKNSNKDYCFSLYSVEGQLMFYKNFRAEIKLDLYLLPVSLYIYEVKSENGDEIYKGKIYSY